MTARPDPRVSRSPSHQPPATNLDPPPRTPASHPTRPRPTDSHVDRIPYSLHQRIAGRLRPQSPGSFITPWAAARASTASGHPPGAPAAPHGSVVPALTPPPPQPPQAPVVLTSPTNHGKAPPPITWLPAAAHGHRPNRQRGRARGGAGLPGHEGQHLAGIPCPPRPVPLAAPAPGPPPPRLGLAATGRGRARRRGGPAGAVRGGDESAPRRWRPRHPDRDRSAEHRGAGPPRDRRFGRGPRRRSGPDTTWCGRWRPPCRSIPTRPPAALGCSAAPPPPHPQHSVQLHSVLTLQTNLRRAVHLYPSATKRRPETPPQPT